MLEVFVLVLVILAVTGWCMYFDERDKTNTCGMRKKRAQRATEARTVRIRRKLYTGVIESNKPTRGKR